jgi:NADH-quinone oxidoreductase subunit J
VLSLLGIAGLYLMLASEFVAVIHVLIYVGAIVTLFLFVIMLTHNLESAKQPQSNRQRVPALILCAGLFGGIAAAMLTAPWATATSPAAAADVQTLGREMLTTHILAFEVISLLLIVALIGAVTLAKREETQP